MFLGDYYVKHYPRFNKLTNEPLQFKTKEEYFDKDFSNHAQLLKWCDKAPAPEVKEYIIKKLKHRIEDKQYSVAPNTIELFASGLPTMDIYKRHFGSYGQACEACGVRPMFSKNLPSDTQLDCSKVKIFIDSREQKPLTFPLSEKLKLDVGDYGVGGDNYSYTHVDRKSFGDLCSTVTIGRDRFEREIERSVELGVFLFIVVEADLYKLKETNFFSPKKYNLDYVFHNIREIQHKFYKNCQFVFSGSRANSGEIIPILLVNGKRLWEVDIQYFTDNGNLLT